MLYLFLSFTTGGTCSSLFSANSVGYENSYNLRVKMFIRIVTVAAANARYNRLYGWGGLYAIGGLITTVMSMHGTLKHVFQVHTLFVFAPSCHKTNPN